MREETKSFLRAILVIALTVASVCAFGQDYRRNGTEFEVIAKEKKADPVKTAYTWKDKDGNIFPIYRSSKGSYFIVKVSKKTGKEYRQYLPKSIKDEIR